MELFTFIIINGNFTESRQWWTATNWNLWFVWCYTHAKVRAWLDESSGMFFGFVWVCRSCIISSWLIGSSGWWCCWASACAYGREFSKIFGSREVIIVHNPLNLSSIHIFADVIEKLSNLIPSCSLNSCVFFISCFFAFCSAEWLSWVIDTSIIWWISCSYREKKIEITMNNLSRPTDENEMFVIRTENKINTWKLRFLSHNLSRITAQLPGHIYSNWCNFPMTFSTLYSSLNFWRSSIKS